MEYEGIKISDPTISIKSDLNGSEQIVINDAGTTKKTTPQDIANLVDTNVDIRKLTTAERDALTPVEGMVIFNTTDSEFQKYIGTAWVTDYNSGNSNLATVDWAAKILTVADKIGIGIAPVNLLHLYKNNSFSIILETISSKNNSIDLMETGNEFGVTGNGVRLLQNGADNTFEIQMGFGSTVKTAYKTDRINGYSNLPVTPPTGAITDPVLVRDSSGNVKQITQVKQTSVASSATPTPTGDARENEYYLTALAAGATFAAPSGTPANGNTLIIRIKDDGTARSLAYNAIYRAIGVTLPTTTVISKTLYLGCIYNSADSKWDVTSVIQEA